MMFIVLRDFWTSTSVPLIIVECWINLINVEPTNYRIVFKFVENQALELPWEKENEHKDFTNY